MSKNLENFIKQHRIEFDDHSPSGKIWTGIEKKLDSSAMPSMTNRFGASKKLVLAIVLLLLLIIVLVIIGSFLNN